jgi:hypothetical protein
MRAREWRIDLVVGSAEERGDRVGVEGGIETGARHGGEPTKPEGQPWSRGARTTEKPGPGLDSEMYVCIYSATCSRCLYHCISPIPRGFS